MPIYDIKYKVTCTLDDGSDCKVNGTDSNVYYGTLSSYNSCVNNTNDGVDTIDFDKATCEVKGYDWVIQKATSDIYFDVENDNVIANIEVVTTEPYEKKLTGTFILKKDKNLVEKTNIDENITKEGIEIAKIQRNLLLKGVDENKVADLAGKGLGEVKQLAKSLKKEGTKIKLWEKPLKLMGQILGMGLDKIQKVKFINLPILGRKKMPQPTVKGFLGGLGRFLLILMVIQPFIQKPVTKLCHKIFGEPKAYLAKKNQETQNSSKGNQNNQNSVKNNDIKTSQQYSRLTKQGEETNLLKKYEQKNNTNDSSASTSLSDSKSVSQPLSDERNSQPSAALNLFNKNKSSDRYIPSIEVVDNSAEQEKQMEKMVDEILKSTDVTIKNVKKVL